ncbi:HAEPLYID family protein [Croceimicrobium sp.]|uniref:HAEPLYID family protein n=1 Tax=Croceimicrobium sp. TaxID=2828340 RepID=UPI003BAB1C68
MKPCILGMFSLLAFPLSLFGQINDAQKDSLFIQEVENQKDPDKVLHAEPLYIDLIRDLGARKGEREWNIGMGLTDNLSFDSYEALIEYEWAPMDRLGLEVELPFTLHSPLAGAESEIPSHRLNSLKVAAQWSFLVNEHYASSMAIGYINEFELSDFNNFARPLIIGNVYNPFLVIAKRWGQNFHSLLYTGPQIAHHYASNQWHKAFEINTSFHYMISGTRNFLGVEINKSIENQQFDLSLRPQMRVAIADNLMIGIVAGIPIKRENERLSSFLRLIWEPGHPQKN